MIGSESSGAKDARDAETWYVTITSPCGCAAHGAGTEDGHRRVTADIGQGLKLGIRLEMSKCIRGYDQQFEMAVFI